MSEKYIFLADDNRDDVALTVRALNRCQVKNKLVIVTNGREALDFLLAPGLKEMPAIILLDLKLPFADGKDILRQLRQNENTMNLPVVVLTASIDEKERQQCLQLGASEFFCKPISFNDFIDIVRHIQGRWLL
jgi:two-component system response regulator